MQIDFQRSSPTSSKGGCGARVGAVIFGLIFAGFGIVFLVLMAKQVSGERAERSWPSTPCWIIRSGVIQDNAHSRDEPYRPVVQYRYTVAGQTRTSDAIKAKDSSFSDYAKAEQIADRYPLGSRATCFVDPHDPARAILEHGDFWIVPFALIPLIFVLIGFAIAWAGLRNPVVKPVSMSLAKSTTAGNTGLMIFFSFFFLIGAGVLVPFFILPAMRLSQAKSWPQVSCTILSSQMQSHRGDKDSVTYSPDIFYQYEFHGQTYHSNHYDVETVNTGNSNTVRAAVARYRPRSRAICYVNPANPHEALLVRQWNNSFAIAAIVPAIFMLVGGLGVLGAARSRKRQDNIIATSGAAIGRSDRMPMGSRVNMRSTGPITLRAKRGPLGNFVGLTFFALFWNGIVLVFVVSLIGSFRHDKFDPSNLCTAAFLSVFVLIGLVLIVAAFSQFLAIFNPRPKVVMDHTLIPLGGSVEVKWSFTGRSDRITRLRIVMEGAEQATNSQGKNTNTSQHVFYRHVVGDITRPMDILSGRAKLAIPSDTMPSFAASHNQINWTLKMHGDIAGWPDVKEDFPIEITPTASPVEAGAQVDGAVDARAIETPPPGVLVIQIDGERTSFGPGGRLTGGVAWHLEKEPRGMDLRLFWYTSGMGTQDVGIVQEMHIETPALGGDRRFTFTLPDRPYSAVGQYLTIHWAMELVTSDGKKSQRAELVMSPSGQPVTLGEPAERDT